MSEDDKPIPKEVLKQLRIRFKKGDEGSKLGPVIGEHGGYDSSKWPKAKNEVHYDPDADNAK